MLSQIQKYSILRYSDLTCPINIKWLFGFSQIFGKPVSVLNTDNEGKKTITVTYPSSIFASLPFSVFAVTGGLVSSQEPISIKHTSLSDDD